MHMVVRLPKHEKMLESWQKTTWCFFTNLILDKGSHGMRRFLLLQTDSRQCLL